MTQRDPDEIKDYVRRRYAARAREKLASMEPGSGEGAGASCCDPPAAAPVEVTLLDSLYSRDELRGLPEETLMSLGCGNPTAIAELKPGEAVLDLGSGGGLDVFLAARQVGALGRAAGLDMTPDMVELARRNAEKVGAANAEFHLGEMERMPFDDASFDVIISNCVINLSPDKDAVFRESYRVLKEGGRFRVSDLVWTREPSAEERADLASWAGCVAGALLAGDYERRLREAGFADVGAHLVGEYGQKDVASAYIEARKPLAGETASTGQSLDAQAGGDISQPPRCC